MPQFFPLPKDEVIKAITRQNPVRIPLVQAKWWGEGLEDQVGSQLSRFDPYPEDVVSILLENPVDPTRMNLSWNWKNSGAHDTRIVIDDWAKLDEFIDKIPDAANNPQWEWAEKLAETAKRENRYILFGWWRFFFEKPWELRGMENLLMDHYTDVDQVHRLHDAMCTAYENTLKKAHERFSPDGFWTSDDLGHQTGAMIDPVIFESLLLPYYKRFRNQLTKGNMHFWLHSCGDNRPLMNHLIDAGVDVFHPVQKHTMDEEEVAETFGDRITFLAGIDVQHTLIEKNPEGVREEVRFLIDTFDRAGGGMCIGAGNGIVAGTPLENIEAFLDEALKYGRSHRKTLLRSK